MRNFKILIAEDDRNGLLDALEIPSKAQATAPKQSVCI